MRVAKSSGTTFPSRNLVRAFFALTLPLICSACAPAKGALAGTIGGVPYVDEVHHDEARPGEFHTTLKVLGHDALFIFLAVSAWPMAVAYGATSAMYGAYQFCQEPIKDNNEGTMPIPRRLIPEGRLTPQSNSDSIYPQ